MEPERGVGMLCAFQVLSPKRQIAFCKPIGSSEMELVPPRSKKRAIDAVSDKCMDKQIVSFLFPDQLVLDQSLTIVFAIGNQVLKRVERKALT